MLQTVNRTEYISHSLQTGPAWLPVLFLLAFILSFSLGMGPINFVLLSDFSLPGLAALASTTAGLTNWGAAFLTTTRHSRNYRV